YRGGNSSTVIRWSLASYQRSLALTTTANLAIPELRRRIVRPIRYIRLSYAETGRSVDGSRVTGKPKSAGINRHVVGDERALQERRAANPSWPRVLQARSRGVA